MTGVKQIEVKLDGVRVVTIIQGDKVEMFTSLRHGHFICQECFAYRQEHRLAV